MRETPRLLLSIIGIAFYSSASYSVELKVDRNSEGAIVINVSGTIFKPDKEAGRLLIKKKQSLEVSQSPNQKRVAILMNVNQDIRIWIVNLQDKRLELTLRERNYYNRGAVFWDSPTRLSIAFYALTSADNDNYEYQRGSWVKLGSESTPKPAADEKPS